MNIITFFVLIHVSPTIMARANTLADAKREERDKNELAIQKALAAYRLEQTKAKPEGLRKVAARFSVSFKTLSNRYNGVPSMAQFNSEKSHLTDAESRKVIDLVIQQAQRGFPLSNRLIEDYVNQVLCAKLEPGYGPEFPGVGVKWTSRWLKKWEKEVSSYWSTSLETVRANALTPENVSHWFNEVYEPTVRSENIPPERQFQADEVGILLGKGWRTRVVGQSGKHVQHSQQSGNRELVTLLPTICGDGTHLVPTVIFKGKNLLRCWVDENPLKCK